MHDVRCPYKLMCPNHENSRIKDRETNSVYGVRTRHNAKRIHDWVIFPQFSGTASQFWSMQIDLLPKRLRVFPFLRFYLFLEMNFHIKPGKWQSIPENGKRKETECFVWNAFLCQNLRMLCQKYELPSAGPYINTYKKLVCTTILGPSIFVMLKLMGKNTARLALQTPRIKTNKVISFYWVDAVYRIRI